MLIQTNGGTMKPFVFAISLGILVLSAAGAWAEDCQLPTTEPTIPNGKVADKAAMLKGSQAVKAYMAETEVFLNCLDEAEKALGEEITAEQQAMFVARHNTAVEAMEGVAEQFNQQIRLYKARRKK
jgi:hypothetical protein